MPPLPDPIVAALPFNALIAVSGDDAEAFLHGQFTNDVHALKPGEAQWNGWCSPKGRLLATFVLARHAGGYHLMLPAELAEAFARRLRMFVLRSKVKIEDASQALARVGIAGTGAGARAAALGGYRLDERFGFVFAAAPALEANADRAAWELALVREGIVNVVAATQEQFVPQMANFDLVGGVSFKKGCYPGQEIVARTQYRGILKRRMARVRFTGAEPRPGESVYSPAFGDQAAGMVAGAAPSPEGGYEALVVAQIEAIAEGGLHRGSPAGPALPVLPLPYAIE